MKISLRVSALAALAMLIGWTVPPVWAQDPLREAVDAGAEANEESAQSQQRIDTLATDQRSMLEEYRDFTAQTDDLKVYNDQLDRLLTQQQAELKGLKQQNGGNQVTQQKLVPLLQRMVETLDQFVQIDAPFLSGERRTRVKDLNALLDDPNVGLTEKYRRVMEAYQVEAEYGRTIEAYTATLPAKSGDGKGSEKERTVNFLRVGRMALLYSALDGSESGYWDKDSKRFKTLPAEFNREIEQGLQIARKEAAPDLLKVPLPPPERTK
jgi:hypothetical protein